MPIRKTAATTLPPAKQAKVIPLQTLRPKGSVLSVQDLSLEDIGGVLSLATSLESEDPVVRMKRLLKRKVALLFYESSTRTRTSFELAAKSLGADTALISAQSSSIEKGESLKDTGITLKALGAECIILRHPSSGAPYLLERSTGLPVLNGGDGAHEHPSQALLDLRTMLAHLRPGETKVHDKSLEGVTVAIVGDILHSRVARSNALLLPRLGAHVILCGPPALLPDLAATLGPGLSIERDFDKALAACQVLMMLRIQAERFAGLHLDLEDYKARYQANGARMAAFAPTALLMHPGPIIRGLELTSEVADGPQSLIAEQVRHGVSIRMALLARALEAASDPAMKVSAKQESAARPAKKARRA